MDIFVKKFSGRDPEKDCSHKPVKIREVGGLDRPPLKHHAGFTGKMRGITENEKYVCYEQITEGGKTKWVKSPS